MARIDEFVHDFDFNEIHRMTVSASPSDALAGVRSATPGEMPLVRLLFALRSWPALLMRGRGLPAERDRPLLAQMVEFGFVPLVETDDELVLGFVGQPWKLMGGSMPRLRSAEEWRAFDECGYVKAVMNFRAESRDVGTILTTETRIRATDAGSRRRFAPYWRVIRVGSGAIRRAWLNAAKRRANSER